MAFSDKLPTKPGMYRHRWIDPSGVMKEQELFVGYTNTTAPKLQGEYPMNRLQKKMRCCRPEEHLHADRLTPKEWGGWWEPIVASVYGEEVG